MTLEQFKAANNNRVQRGQRVVHPIYGAGDVVAPAQGVFAFVAFDAPRAENMAVLAVSMNVCATA